ncbi:hypothetical protein MYXO_02988 [Myxococcaceae bacterium]|jgi:HlyD family secretion protein|nr:hypothetical protein MYXO_02988 [Myxococcaceae bacterium]
MRRRLVLAAIAVVGLAAGVWSWRSHDGSELRFTGFVEGEERVLRAEVSGRVIEVAFREGDRVLPGAVVARIDASDIDARLVSKREELGVLDAQIARQREEVATLERTWKQEVAAGEAELRRAKAAADLAVRTHVRQESLVAQGVATAQRLDETRSNRDQTRSSVDAASETLERIRAEEGRIEIARRQLDVLARQRDLSAAQLAELEVLRSKYEVRAPDVATVVQTQMLFAGELAQPGTPVLSVLDPVDKYVQIFIPVPDVSRVPVGTRVSIELDSDPGRSVPGEVSFIADQANFTPEKIETRSDRIGQVYRGKVRILEGVERFQPGTEGEVRVVDETAAMAARTARSGP